tara:strand:- start:26289 stop:28889 length:2601 start_codon:yes stop_codon:yes gene_type:complete
MSLYKHLSQQIKVVMALMFILNFFSTAQALETYLPEGKHNTVIKVEYRRDNNNILALNDVRQPAIDSPWLTLEEDYANFGYQAVPYWYRFTISNPKNTRVNHIIDISYPLLDSVDIYAFYQGEQVEEIHLGDRLPYDNRLIDHPHFLVPIELQAQDKRTYYVRVMTQGSQLFPVELWESSALFVKLGKEDELHAIYFGVVSVIVFFNLLIFIALKEKMYLYYALSALVFMLFFGIMRAKLFPIIFSDLPEFHHILLLILPPSCLLFSALFSRELLKPDKYLPSMKWFFSLLIGISWLSFAGVFIFDSQTSLKFSVLSAIPSCFALFLVGPIFALKGNKMAWVYSVAWGTFMMGATITAASKQGFIPVNFLTEYGMQIGSAVELFILNAALAFRFHIEHQGRLSAQLAQLKEQQEKQETERKLLIKSMTDSVTNLPNRVCFEANLQDILDERIKQRIAVCVIEIQRFNEINRTLGHHNTDLLMVEIGHHFDELMSNLPGLKSIESMAVNANISALGQGSFGLLMDASIAEANQDLVSLIIKKMTQPIVFKDMRIELRPLIGVAIYPEHGVNTASLIRHAQVAVDMPEALQHVISFYRPEHDQYNTRRLMMVSELKHAIEQDHLELFFQPKLDLKTKEITGLEALVRWHHERYGLVCPDEFITLAEETGIIKALTRWVIQSAFNAYLKFEKQGYDYTMSINISALNLQESDLIVFLKEQLYLSGIEPSKICLELTETSMMAKPLDAIEVLERVRRLGLTLSIDDFGAGYSSLAYLKSLPASEIKIDKSLIAGICDDINSDMVARATIDMCQGLGFKIVAEGVENKAVLNRLVELGCDTIQGYILTPPLPYPALINWLEGNLDNKCFVS